MTDLYRRAIVCATKQIWLADAAGKTLLADTWTRELRTLIQAYQECAT